MLGRVLVPALTLVCLTACQPASPFKANEAVVRITIAANGAIGWNGEKVSLEEAQRRLRLEGARDPKPALHIIPDPRTHYEDLMRIMVAAQRYGLTKLGVVGGS